MKTASKRPYTADEIRAELLAAGLTEAEQAIDGRAYTLRTGPGDALALFESRSAQNATRFYLDRHLYILSR